MSWVVFASSGLLAWCYGTTPGGGLRRQLVHAIAATIPAAILVELLAHVHATPAEFVPLWLLVVGALVRVCVKSPAHPGRDTRPFPETDADGSRPGFPLDSSPLALDESRGGLDAASRHSSEVVRPTDHAGLISLAPHMTKAAGFPPRGLLSDHRLLPGDADSSEA